MNEAEIRQLAAKVIEDFKEHYSLPYGPASEHHLEDCIVSAIEGMVEAGNPEACFTCRTIGGHAPGCAVLIDQMYVNTRRRNEEK